MIAYSHNIEFNKLQETQPISNFRGTTGTVIWLPTPEDRSSFTCWVCI